MRPHRKRGTGRGWRLVRGIHRRVVTYLLLAVALGVAAGWALAAAVAAGATSSAGCLVVGLFLLVWPLAWVATFRIARPVSRLAEVAGELRQGRLASRDRLEDAGDDEVGAVAGALRGMADRVAKQLQDQRALMAAVSHELRSPLARVRVLVELAREGAAGAEVHDDLQSEVDAMDALVGDLLAAARIDFEALSPRPLQARDVALRALEIAQLSPDLLDAADPAVHADATLLARALAVLLDNATRHGGAPTALRVRADDAGVRFEVEDAGPGFGPGEEEMAFQPFWRRPGAAPGVGLGLALVRQIAEAHGGTAGASNRDGPGARAWIRLPNPPMGAVES